MAKMLQFRCFLSHTYHRMWKETKKKMFNSFMLDEKWSCFKSLVGWASQDYGTHCVVSYCREVTYGKANPFTLYKYAVKNFWTRDSLIISMRKSSFFFQAWKVLFKHFFFCDSCKQLYMFASLSNQESTAYKQDPQTYFTRLRVFVLHQK